MLLSYGGIFRDVSLLSHEFGDWECDIIKLRTLTFLSMILLERNIIAWRESLFSVGEPQFRIELVSRTAHGQVFTNNSLMHIWGKVCTKYRFAAIASLNISTEYFTKEIATRNA
jgi:hypothetical protein